MGTIFLVWVLQKQTWDKNSSTNIIYLEGDARKHWLGVGNWDWEEKATNEQVSLIKSHFGQLGTSGRQCGHVLGLCHPRGKGAGVLIHHSHQSLSHQGLILGSVNLLNSCGQLHLYLSSVDSGIQSKPLGRETHPSCHWKGVRAHWNGDGQGVGGAPTMSASGMKVAVGQRKALKTAVP